jgi:hypothetical protein
MHEPSVNRRDQCAEAGVPFFMLQMTGRERIPVDLFVRQFPRWLKKTPREMSALPPEADMLSALSMSALCHKRSIENVTSVAIATALI